jgi:site-specific DNA recombinase
VRSVTEPIDTATPMGRTIFAVLAGMAEQERQTITERTWSGRRAKAGQGGFAGGGTPYGYRRDLEGGLVVDELEAADRQARSSNCTRPSNRTPRSRARSTRSARRLARGAPWRHGGIGYILDNPKYRGDVEYLFRWSGAEQLVLQRGAHQPMARTSQIIALEKAARIAAAAKPAAKKKERRHG